MGKRFFRNINSALFTSYKNGNCISDQLSFRSIDLFYVLDLTSKSNYCKRAESRKRAKSLKICALTFGFKERLNKEQLGNSEPFLVTYMPVHLINWNYCAMTKKFLITKFDCI